MKHAKRTRTKGSQEIVNKQEENPALIVPFGPAPCPHEVQMARFLVWDTYARARKLDIHQTVSELDTLFQCIKFNPHLKPEATALDGIIQSGPELYAFQKSALAEVEAGKASGLHRWFLGKLDGGDKKPFEAFLCDLLEIQTILWDRTEDGALFRAVSAILMANSQMIQLRNWQNQL